MWVVSDKETGEEGMWFPAYYTREAVEATLRSVGIDPATCNIWFDENR